MVRRDRLHRSSALALVAVIGFCGLAACNRSGDSAAVSQASAVDALPLTTAAAAPLSRAPAADALPAASRAQVGRVSNRDDDYAYLDQAYYQGDAYEDSPPDYAFDYDGVSPWAWQGPYGQEFVEPASDGWRYYYYRSGASLPYLVRDGGYAYGFDGPRLVVVYDREGRLLRDDETERRADLAGRYLARAQGLLSASRSASRRGVAADHWAAARGEIASQRARLTAVRSRQSAWLAYDSAHAANEQARWEPERSRRQDYAQRFDGWRQTHYQGAAPAPVRGEASAPRRDAGVLQAQVEPPVRQDAPRSAAPIQTQPAPPPPTPDRRLAEDPRRQAQDQANAQRQAADQQRQRDDQARAQLAQQQQAQRGHDEQVRQQASDQRQRDDQARNRVVEQQQQQQQRAQNDQARQQAAQQRQVQDQSRQQQRAQADQQGRQAEPAARQQQAEQAQAQQKARAQAQAQAQPQARQQQAQQQAQPAQPAAPAARPAALDEHREKNGKDQKDQKEQTDRKDRKDQ